MNSNLTLKFEKMGARVKVAEGDNPMATPIRLDVLRDKNGEYFDLRINNPEAEVTVLDVQPDDRHLLLLVRRPNELRGGGVRYEKAKFLCGHDERHWFVAAIPESAPVGTVAQAKESLKPVEVREALNQAGIGIEERNSRRNEVFKRQGEWFFVPAPNLKVDETLLIRNEPISRGRGSKPHRAEFCYRTGGTAVWVNHRYPNGIPFATYQKVLADNPGMQFTQRVRDAEVYVRGNIRHDDHKTIFLDGWHRVLMNTENQSVAMRNVAFLD